MKKTLLIIISVSAVFLLNTCALEIANVIGPDGGYVFYDKGNYDSGWRYVQCSSYDHGEIIDGDELSEVNEEETIEKILLALKKGSAEWYSFKWEIPTEADLRKMLNCFSYGLTRFSSDYYYLAVNNLYKPEPPGTSYDTSGMTVVILHKDFSDKANGEVKRVTDFPDNFSVRIRPLRRF